MRFIHTADWHIGRLFHNLSLLDDQSHVLEQLLEILADTRADALIVAGDVYERAVPPADAVRLLDEVIARITRGCWRSRGFMCGVRWSPVSLRLRWAIRGER